MEILRRGKPKAEDTFTAECVQCGTQVRFKRSEATFVPDQRDGDYYTVKCPVCSGLIYVDARLANR